MAPAFAPEQELRIALVLYGGVSLAIYMYGVVEELHHLVRSTAPEESYAAHGDPPHGLLYPEPESTEAVYRELGRLLPAWRDDEPSADERPVRTRFVVDIISGTSAGGINGVCLAKALVNEAELAGLKDVWLDEGGIASLVNDSQSTYRRTPDGALGEKIEGLGYDRSPKSLLSGRRMLHTLVSVLSGMNRPEENAESRSRLVDELDLWVTATDLEGLDVPIRIANATVTEKWHPNRYRFRYSPEDGRHDFDLETDPFMAYVARSTSAFPFAFSPAVLTDLEPYVSAEEWPAAIESWRRFHRSYDSASPAFEDRSFSDGGILDNKPFSYATDSLVARRATVPVDRYLIYVEPDPGARAAPHKESWNAFETARAAVLGIPRLETIREDLQTVLARNREIARARDVIARMDPGRERIKTLTSPAEPREWAMETLSSTRDRGDWGPSYGVYHGLKVDSVIDFLASILVRARGFEPRSDHSLAVQYLARAWKKRRYNEEGEGGREPENALLLAFDLPYRVRRIDFVLQKLKELVGSDTARAARLMATADIEGGPIPLGAERDEAVRTLRRGLQDAREELTDVEARVVTGRAGQALAAAIADLQITVPDLKRVLDAASHDHMLREAGSIVAAHSQAFDALAEALEAQLHLAGDRSREKVDATLQLAGSSMDPVRQALRFFYDTYEAYDLAAYPLQFGSELGETNPVKIVRVSPRDALGPGGKRRDPKGIQLGHFGAFLERRWRREDMVWGRLDAAECVIGALLGEGHRKRQELIDAAQRRIILDYANESGVGSAEAWDWFWRKDRVPGRPEQKPTEQALGRAQVVVGEIVEDVLSKRGDGASGDTVRRSVRPVVEAILAGRSRTAAVGALVDAALQSRPVIWIARVWGGVVLGAPVVAVFGGELRWLGLVLLGAGVALGGAVLAGLYVAVSRLRRFIEQSIDRAVFKQEEPDQSGSSVNLLHLK